MLFPDPGNKLLRAFLKASLQKSSPATGRHRAACTEIISQTFFAGQKSPVFVSM
jgi:hypothetical protein